MKVEIEVDVPEGWKAVSFRYPKEGESYVSTTSTVETAEHDFKHVLCMIVEKEKPVRRVFEFTGEVRVPNDGDYFATGSGSLILAQSGAFSDDYPIWREVTEEIENE